MLYTVRPLEKVYATPASYQRSSDRNKPEEQAKEEYKEVLLAHGRVITRRDGDNYIVEQVNSTDMKDYLNDAYYPGKIIQK